MNSNSTESMTYAAVLKNSLPRKRYNSECVQKTWFDQLIEYEQDELRLRSASPSHLPSEVETTNCSALHTNNRLSTENSHENSYENLNCKVSASDSDSCIDTMDTSSDDKSSQKDERRSSVDSNSTTSSSGCSTVPGGESRTESCTSNKPSTSTKPQTKYETDQAVLGRRQKQIDYGKNTIGYDCYLEQVPKHLRTNEQPQTPKKHRKYSRRGFDRLIRIWRKDLHQFDPKDSVADNHVERNEDS